MPFKHVSEFGKESVGKFQVSADTIKMPKGDGLMGLDGYQGQYL